SGAEPTPSAAPSTTEWGRTRPTRWASSQPPDRACENPATDARTTAMGYGRATAGLLWARSVRQRALGLGGGGAGAGAAAGARGHEREHFGEGRLVPGDRVGVSPGGRQRLQEPQVAPLRVADGAGGEHQPPLPLGGQ